MSDFTLLLFMAFMALTGGILARLDLENRQKWAVAGLAVAIVPSLFWIPAIFNRDGDFAGLLAATGFIALLAALVAIVAGWTASLLLQYWRGRKG